MSENIFIRIHKEIEDARADVQKAMELARGGRGEALEADDMKMTKLFKEIEFILKDVLEK